MKGNSNRTGVLQGVRELSGEVSLKYNTGTFDEMMADQQLILLGVYHAYDSLDLPDQKIEDFQFLYSKLAPEGNKGIDQETLRFAQRLIKDRMGELMKRFDKANKEWESIED